MVAREPKRIVQLFLRSRHAVGVLRLQRGLHSGPRFPDALEHRLDEPAHDHPSHLSTLARLGN
ncbi:hypothetical protein HRW07_29475 [Streptomyces lunaelactis]|uniref:hypothetical protein n=1 Tax=Streptomyces lunaelactis TaxID=1535768 RepID=UPI001585330A|nr:hypothetical protein [Streptomyces lunaelactis]NUL07275.1 hypothetical protein [Streptomyces lunaelactis]